MHLLMQKSSPLSIYLENGVEKPLNFDPFGHAELSLFAKI